MAENDEMFWEKTFMELSTMARKRMSKNLTLGGLLKILNTLPYWMPVDCDADFFCYRGYYDDLAIGYGQTTVEDLQRAAREALGETFHGYKGGDYVMDLGTLLWHANDERECSNLAVVGVTMKVQDGLLFAYLDTELVE